VPTASMCRQPRSHDLHSAAAPVGHPTTPNTRHLLLNTRALRIESLDISLAYRHHYETDCHIIFRRMNDWEFFFFFFFVFFFFFFPSLLPSPFFCKHCISSSLSFLVRIAGRWGRKEGCVLMSAGVRGPLSVPVRRVGGRKGGSTGAMIMMFSFDR